VLEKECLELNSAFFTFMNKKRPYIILKWAETADGFIARKDFDSKWISNPLSRQLVHKLRTQIDAILVGKNTVLYDDPQLTARDWPGKSPIRLVVDHQLELKDDLKIFDGEQKTILFYSTQDKKPSQDVESVQLNENDFLNEMMQYLHSQNIQSVLVEGGTQTVQSFIGAGLWDEARIFKSPVVFETGIRSPQLKHHTLVSQENIQGKSQTDILSVYHKSKLP